MNFKLKNLSWLWRFLRILEKIYKGSSSLCSQNALLFRWIDLLPQEESWVASQFTHLLISANKLLVIVWKLFFLQP